MNSFSVKIHPTLEDKSKTKVKSKRIKLDLDKANKKKEAGCTNAVASSEYKQRPIFRLLSGLLNP